MSENSPQWTLRRRVAVLCLLLATLVTFLAIGAAATAMANRGQTDTLVNQVAPMRTAASNLLGALVGQESGVRGFVISGAEADLALYLTGIDTQREQTAAIEASPLATSQIRDELAAVNQLADRWHATVTEPAIAAMRAHQPDQAQALLGPGARVQFDAIRSALTLLQTTLQHLRDDLVTSIKDTSTTLLFVLITATILVIAGGVGLMILLQRTVITPVTDLAAQVRAVARGAYDLDIATDGPPELVLLARDVDTMRQRIAADLAEVDRARRTIEETNLALEQQAAELTRSNRDLEQFAYVASHDLQEPLRKVASFCQLLRRRYAGQLDEQADQYIEFAVNGAQRMQRLINDLLAFSRIGRGTAGIADVDLDRVVADAVAELDGVAGSAEAAVTWSDLPVVRGEETLLRTLFANLIGNSLKFRRPDVACRITIAAQPAGELWEVSCIDNGIGIEPEFAEKVFVIFQRLHARDAYPGTGIGLAMAKKIVEYHGGTIWIDPDYRDGTAIRFTLPGQPVAERRSLVADAALA
jgi:signal transduction histidine kinase